MAQRRPVPKRRRFFIGAEGESERSLARWLKQLCDEADLHVHLDIVVCGGGDSLTVVKHSVNQYRQRTTLYGRFSAGLIILDGDRIEEDKLHDRDPLTGLVSENLRLVYLIPKLEGLLLRLHPGYESNFVLAHEAERSLRKQWPKYDKPASAKALGRRFKLQDLRRVAQQDTNIRLVLETLGLLH